MCEREIDGETERKEREIKKLILKNEKKVIKLLGKILNNNLIIFG